MPFVWALITWPIVLLMQRWIHRHLHGLAFLLTGNKNWAVVLYAIVLFPGVLLHELSHWLTASLLGVRTSAFSVLPKVQPDGSIQLGYVEYYRPKGLGSIRESIIGSAPLVFGTLAIILIGLRVFDIPAVGQALQTGETTALNDALRALFETNDFVLWLYLLFAISNAMMPSAADRRAWPAFITIVLIAIIILYLLGLQEILILGLAGPVATVFGYVGLAFSLTIGVNIIFMLLIALFEQLISNVRGIELVYSDRADEGSQ